MRANCLTALAGFCLLLTGAAQAETRKYTSVVRADARTGRLVRTVVMSNKPMVPRGLALQPAAVSAPVPATLASELGINEMIDETARRHEIDPLLVHSVVQVESNYNPFAVSPKGAEGLMQLIPSTARRFGAVNSFNPRENLEAGVRYLKYLQDTFQDDDLALAAYNAGEAAVVKYGTIPPYRETEDYVYRVGKKYSEARKKSGRAAETPVTKPVPVLASQTAEPPLRQLETYTDSEGRVYLRTR